ncbi:MAG: 2-hydroxyacid dehydrogenase [Rubrobacteraceae bacterium]|nr:2-hydroxyacid dehydrogenase [Rubrobacteraceae bacterium]
MEVLAVGDRFVPAGRIREAIKEELGERVRVREVLWSGDSTEEQHRLQQIMEKKGPGAVPVPDAVIQAAKSAGILVVHFAPVPEVIFGVAPGLRAVVVARAGYENVDVEAASRRGVVVANVEGRNAPAVAEQALGLMLAEARDLARADAGIRAGGWPKEFPSPARELGRSTVGLIGFGYVARELALRLSGFRVRLLVYDPYVDEETVSSFGGEKVGKLETIFRESDFVSLHARLTPENGRFIGREHFELMKPTAYFINNARSRMVRYDELYEALAERRIAGAALDVHDEEPLPSGSPWRSLENVTLTPHIAGATPETKERTVRLVARAVRELLETGNCSTVVNVPSSGKR